MTELKAEYVTETVTKSDSNKTKSVAWHCVTDEHGGGCGAVMGAIQFDPTRLKVGYSPEVVIRGDAEVRCKVCGKWQDWHWEREHPLIKRIEERKKDC